ncbi:ChrR family anti-sigma-E factor [Pseudohongiella sp. SYSU M77423]|uniref:ChrR family anti-sigma-E factor n=1 Tax=unclassified Pseudohongiella TaxID=2629611 RepID=UPI001F013AFF|nr:MULTISPECIES: ChrR family anti-sigma-E factor [unclassified Pseudohongiella]MDH7942798.1 ChrR family anti-sigma-E factor [Pseudohongiella sp. SYSU M77423]
MVTFHPDSRFLTDYAAGTLPTSEAICVAAHLEFCAKCRAHAQQLSDLGAQIMAAMEPAVDADSSSQDDDFMRLMNKIDARAADASKKADISVPDSARTMQSDNHSAAMSGMPRILQKLTQTPLESMRWVQLGKYLRVAPVGLGSAGRDIALYDIKAGGQMPEHEHHGEEITVLLKGSFSDAEGQYVRGDFVVRNAGEKHQPTATMDTDCLCLVSLEQPIRPTSIWYRLLDPLVNMRLSSVTN